MKIFLMPFMFISMSGSLFFAGMVSAEPYTVKGDQLGMSLTEYKARHTAEEERGSPCEDGNAFMGIPGIAGIVVCAKWHSYSLAGEKADVTFYFVSEKPKEPSTGKLARFNISFNHHNSYLIILAAMLEKFGTPDTQKRGVVQNKMGAKFGMVVSQWKNETGEITLKEFDGSIDRSSLLFTHNKLSSLMNKRIIKAQNKKALDDM